MKKIIKPALMIFALFCFLFGGAECVVVDEALPLAGEYVFLYNSGDSSVNIENLPVPSGINQSNERENTILKNVSGSIKLDGEIFWTEEMTFPDIEDFPVMLLSLDDDYRQFSATDSYNNSSYPFFANKRFESENVKVYVEEGAVSTASEETNVATNIGNKFEDILTYINENFASYEGQTTVLIHDIKDANYYGKSSSFVAGYFSPSEYNYERIVHIDLYPLMARSNTQSLNASNSYKTLAHEFTHLVEHSVNNSNTKVNDMWFSEMFALSSEAGMFKNESDSTRLFDLVRDYNGVIRGGAVVNYAEYAENSSDLSANYGLLYAFTSYLKTQFGGDVFKNILASSILAESSEEALLDGIKASSGNEITFEELLKNFYMALILNDQSGTYKLMDTNYAHFLNMPFNLSETVELKPKASVVIPLFNEEFDASGLDENIKYTVFSRDEVQAIQSVEMGNDNKVTCVARNMTQLINPLINGKKLIVAGEGTNSELFSRIMFIAEDDEKVFFGKDGIVLGLEEGVFKVRCQSLLDKDVFSDFELISGNAPVCINHYSDAYFDETNNGILVGVNIFNTAFDEENTLSIYFAVYDENSKMIGCTRKDVNFASRGVFYQRGIQFDGIDKNKKYILKMFIFKSDGGLYPLSGEYRTKYNM